MSSSSRRLWPADWRSRIDLIIRLVLVIGFAFWGGICLRSCIAIVRQIDFAHPSSHLIGQLLSVMSVGLFTTMYAVLYAIRLKPVSKFPGLLPSAVAIAGGFMMLGVSLFTPREDLPLSVSVTAITLVVIGNTLSAFIIVRLGRSFSIVPEGRRLVTTGPYAIVRNPLYLAEAVSTVGTVINYSSFGVMILFAAHVILQVMRIFYEETVLRETFPEYADYARRTWRLVPGIF